MTSIAPWASQRAAPKTGERGLVPGLATPHPLGPALPALYQEDSFTQQFVRAFDDSLAPILCALDNLDSYFDPELTPEDFLAWLGGWVGVLMDEAWPLERRRSLVADAVGLYTLRGTVAGMTRHVELYTGGRVEIDDGGGVQASPAPLGPLPGRPGWHFTVRVVVEDPETIDARRVELLVAASKPAHLAHRIEIVRAESAPPAPDGQAPPPEAPE